MMLTRPQVRDIDRHAIEQLGIPGPVLMENAGRGTAEILTALGIFGPVAICCGKGNNGGDGMVIARHLFLGGYCVNVLLCADPGRLSADAALQYQIIDSVGIACEVIDGDVQECRVLACFARCAWIVDALFGTGLQGPVRPPHDRVIAALNASSARVLAVDIPSGLDADRGVPLGPTVRADHTATFVAPKAGFANPDAAAWLGNVHVVGIGCSVALPPISR